MAEVAVGYLLQNLRKLLIDHVKLINGAEKQVEQLDKDLKLLKAFLENSITKNLGEDDVLRDCLVGQIHNVVYEVEDIIDAFLTKEAISKSKNRFFRSFQNPLNLIELAKQVESVAKEVNDVYGGKSRLDFVNSNAASHIRPQKQQVQLVGHTNVLGLEDETRTLKGYLHEQTQRLDVISITGMPGLGKTTLAKKIFDDPEIKIEFPTRIWVDISQVFKTNNVFLLMLRELFTTLPKETYHKTSLELAKMVASELADKKAKFLVVMDDVWETTHWRELQLAFPQSNNMGKVLITSRHKKVACRANPHRNPVMLKIWTPCDSWLLLKYEVFGKPECPSELEVLGRKIAKQCHGLPLAIVVIGGILVKNFSAVGDLTARKNMWTKVAESTTVYMREDPDKEMEKIIRLSYDNLPYHLRDCFLYLGIFPEDFEIPVWQLVQMWIAEGFIQQKKSITLEETAENYLEDLISRNLVTIEQMRSDGRVKKCRIHDMLRDFCKNEAENGRQNFLQEIKKTIDENFEPSIEKSRRLCIHSDVFRFLSSKFFKSGPHVRSFVCLSEEDITLTKEISSTPMTAFKLLRVLDCKPINFTRIPKNMYQLVHARYIHITICSNVLPRSFSKLMNIQTLIVETSSPTLEIKAKIWKMISLRHLKTNASAILPKPGKSSKEGEKLWTLGKISPESCTKEIFGQACNLKKLIVRGKLAKLIDGKSGGSFDNFARLAALQKLELVEEGYPIKSLPPAYTFPQKLKNLTLSSTYLDWGQMSILGSLGNLKKLKLKNNAFMGTVWETANGGFGHLEVLHIGDTNLVTWKVLNGHFPELIHLKLRNCKELNKIPSDLANITSFRKLDLFHTESAVASAKMIREAKLKKPDEGTSEGSGFNLVIFPPNE